MIQTKTIVYRAYGKLSVKYDTLLSVLSILHQHGYRDNERTWDPGFQIIIFTDEPAFFNKILRGCIGIHYRPLPPEKLKEYRGKNDFVHRVKICILIELEGELTPGSPILYLDGDTYIIGSLDPIWEMIERDEPVMHLPEGILANKENPILRKMYHFVKGFKAQIDEKEVRISPRIMMWNSGVLGYKSGDKGFLETTLALTDALYDAYPKHVMEQLAFSYTMTTRGIVGRSDHIVGHYWWNKEHWKTIMVWLQVHEKAYLSELVAHCSKVKPELTKPPEKPNFWKRLWSSSGSGLVEVKV